MRSEGVASRPRAIGARAALGSGFTLSIGRGAKDGVITAIATAFLGSTRPLGPPAVWSSALAEAALRGRSGAGPMDRRPGVIVATVITTAVFSPPQGVRSIQVGVAARGSWPIGARTPATCRAITTALTRLPALGVASHGSAYHAPRTVSLVKTAAQGKNIRTGVASKGGLGVVIGDGHYLLASIEGKS